MRIVLSCCFALLILSTLSCNKEQSKNTTTAESESVVIKIPIVKE